MEFLRHNLFNCFLKYRKKAFNVVTEGFLITSEEDNCPLKNFSNKYKHYLFRNKKEFKFIEGVIKFKSINGA